MSYNMRHALNTMFCLLSMSYLVSELFCCLHTTVMLTVCYIDRQPGREYHYSEINACGESAASKNALTLYFRLREKGDKTIIRTQLYIQLNTRAKEIQQFNRGGPHQSHDIRPQTSNL